MSTTPKQIPPAVEDDERYTDQVDAFVARNRDALNDFIREARKQVAAGKISTKSIDEIIADGRRRHGG
jgi:hypothetical protein